MNLVETSPVRLREILCDHAALSKQTLDYRGHVIIRAGRLMRANIQLEVTDSGALFSEARYRGVDLLDRDPTMHMVWHWTRIVKNNSVGVIVDSQKQLSDWTDVLGKTAGKKTVRLIDNVGSQFSVRR